MTSVRLRLQLTGAIMMILACAAAAPAQIVKKCPRDSVQVGNACIDIYEASVWLVADPMGTGKSVVKKIKKGTVTLADLTAAGAVQLGCDPVNYPGYTHAPYPGNFPKNGNWTPIFGTVPPTPGVYAVSIPGVSPTACISGYRMEQACALSGKRLIRNDEWQRAAAGTPDPGTDNGTTDCKVGGGPFPVATGSRANCRSRWGVYDMVGNINEYTSDSVDAYNPDVLATDWTTQTGIAGDDASEFGGGGEDCCGGMFHVPLSPARGGSWGSASAAGVFKLGVEPPGFEDPRYGFRCAR